MMEYSDVVCLSAKTGQAERSVGYSRYSQARDNY